MDCSPASRCSIPPNIPTAQPLERAVTSDEGRSVAAPRILLTEGLTNQFHALRFLHEVTQATGR